VFSRDDILNQLRGHEAELYTRAVDIVISRLRKARAAGLHQDLAQRRLRAGRGAAGTPDPWLNRAASACGRPTTRCATRGATAAPAPDRPVPAAGPGPHGDLVGGMQKALSLGWRDAARPLVSDYVDRLVAELGSPPQVERAQALVQRLPITLRISGPQVNWVSDPPPRAERGWRHPHPRLHESENEGDGLAAAARHRRRPPHRAGPEPEPGQYEPRRIGWYTLALLLLLTAGSYLYLRRPLRPLDDIRAGARRFGQGDFGSPCRCAATTNWPRSPPT
jgi:hypothetical protein